MATHYDTDDLFVRGLLQASPDGVSVIDLQGRFLRVNQRGAEMLGFSHADDLTNQSVFDFFARREIESARRELAEAVAEGKPRVREFQLLRRDGSTLLVEIAIDLIRDDKGTIVAVVAITRDISERRRLDQRVQVAQQMEAIGRLAGGVAHDFNNILAIINCYTAFVRDEMGDNPTVAADLDTIREAATRAERLTNQLLAYSRRQLQKLEILDLDAVVSEVAKMLRRLIGEDITLEVETSPGLWSIEADRGQVEQILLHLAINGRDAMPQGGQLTVTTRNLVVDREHPHRDSEIPAGEYLSLVVSDSGTGMTAEVRDRIFEPFFTTKGLGKGTGLGLAMIYGVVKQSNGHITIDSAPGSGTTVEILLPRFHAVAAGEEPDDRAAVLAPDRVVLIVEDEAQVREAARRILVRAGHTVLCAGDGREALDLCAHHDGPIHLMLTDVVMPRMSGKELADRLARLRPEMRVLYMSGYPENALSERGVISADLPFLPKPFLPDELLAKVGEALAD